MTRRTIGQAALPEGQAPMAVFGASRKKPWAIGRHGSADLKLQERFELPKADPKGEGQDARSNSGNS